jgi:hypothetical protein
MMGKHFSASSFSWKKDAASACMLKITRVGYYSTGLHRRVHSPSSTSWILSHFTDLGTALHDWNGKFT